MIQQLNSNRHGALIRLLTKAHLPTADVARCDWFSLLGYDVDDALVAAGGLERCGESLLLRSLVTHSDYRGRGYGAGVIVALHSAAALAGYGSCWLLTTDAGRYFSQRHRYEIAQRSSAPEGIRESAQFSGLCPDSAVLMVRWL